jgi:hypothetical protein
LKSLLGSETGRQIVADALVAAASAASAALVAARSENVQKAGNKVVDAAEDHGAIARNALMSAASAVTDVLGKAARTAFGADADNDRGNGAKPARARTH